VTILEVAGITKRFGGLEVLKGVDLTVQPGQITSLIGPNGAGKTTLFNCITGVLAPDGGSVRLGGRPLDDLAMHERAAAGLGRTFQRLEVFANMSVYENLQVAAEARHPGRAWKGVLRWSDRPDDDVAAEVAAALDRVGMTDEAHLRAGDLSTGRLRMLELGRSLCTQPDVLLLDEPASGLDVDETAEFDRLLRALADDGLGILLVEHDVDLVLAVSTHVYCLDFGQIIAEGGPDKIIHDPHVKAAYLGITEEDDDASVA